VVVSAPIAGYVGGNGKGKTLGAMIFDVVPALQRGMPVVTTVPINHHLATNLSSWRDIWFLHDCVLFLDDISAQLPARESQKMPPQLVIKLNTLRHDGVRVVWTAPHWRRADTVLREVTQEVTVCDGMFPDRFLREKQVPRLRLNARPLEIEGKAQRVQGLWKPNRLFRFKTYDATRFDEFTESKREKMKCIRQAWYWRPWHDEQWLYDTEAAVSIMDHVDQGGMCLVCGGRQARKSCTCADGATTRGAARKAEPRTASRVVPGPVPVPAVDTATEWMR